MAIFARRRLQTMLDELSPLMDLEQSRGLVRRMESKEIEQALPAEMELGLTWAIAKLGPIEIEPEWYSEKRLPDLFSDYLFPGHETVIEITALSDAVLPADEGMRNASRKLSQEAGSLRRGAGRHLSYYFYEKTVRIERGSIRRVCVPRDLVVSDAVRIGATHKVPNSAGQCFRQQSTKMRCSPSGLGTAASAGTSHSVSGESRLLALGYPAAALAW